MKKVFALVVAVAMIATLCVFTSADEVTDGLVAHYELSSDLTDSVGSADGSVIYHNVTETTTAGSSEVTYSDGALVIADGSDVGVKFPVSGITSDFTVSVELTILGSLGWASPFVWIGGTDQSPENWIGIWSGFSNGTETFVEVGSNDASGNRYAVASGLTQTPTSTITVTLTVASNVASYYINGELVGSTENMPNPWTAEDCAIYIGANAWGDPNTNASYNNLYVYNRALTSTEVATLCGVEASSETTEAETTEAETSEAETTTTSNVYLTTDDYEAYLDDGAGCWGESDGYTNTAEKAWDGDTSTYYDCNNGSGGYTGVQLKTATAIQAVTVTARSGYEYRLPGCIIQGSTDGTTWVDLYTLTEEASVTVEISDTTAYTYYRFYSGEESYCNVAEVVLYTTYAPETAPQTGFAFVTLGVVALASGTAIVVSKKKH